MEPQSAAEAVHPPLGPYRALGLLGAGGMARVYAARAPDGALRAVKLLTVPGAMARRRFAREASAQLRVDHPNVLPLLEVLEVPGGLALVLPLVDGPSLAVLLERCPASSARLALFRQVVAGVAAIHRAGVVHRDLKPQNVLVQVDGDTVTARVADFGLAKAADDPRLTGTGAELGTRAYMAPEQRLDGSRADARVDVWALGVLLRELLGPDPSAAWTAVADQLTAVDPMARPADAHEILERLPPTDPVGPELAALCRALAPTVTPLDAPTFDLPVRGHLPREHDPFVGRDAELVEVGAALADGGRLVTLVGPAGVGKTRLAVRFAGLWHEDWAGGVWFCDLSHATGFDDLVAAVAGGLGVALGAADPHVQLGHALAGRGPCLLVLDNVEQLVADAERAIEPWMHRAQELQVLVTSRVPLGMPGERTLRVAPLAPSDAEALFVVRARAARGRGLDLAEHAELAGLTDQLDGLPLAIELCAARARLLTVGQIAGRMNDRFRLLADVGGTEPRRSALHASLSWSWELCAPWERAALAQLSVFEDGMSVDAAEAVLDLSAWPEAPWRLDVLDALVNQSLLQVVDARAERRLRMLLSVRAFAQQMDPAQADAAERRHGAHFTRLDTERSSVGGELANLVAACRRAIARRDGVTAADVLRAGSASVALRGSATLGLHLVARVAALELPPEQQVVTHLAAGRFLHLAGRNDEAQRHHALALPLAEAVGDTKLVGSVFLQLGLCHQAMGRADAAIAATEASVRAFEAIGDQDGVAIARGNLGNALFCGGDGPGGLAALDAALAHHRTRGNRFREGQVLCNRAIFHASLGRFDEALADFEASLPILREVGDRRFEAILLAGRGILRADLGALALAVDDLAAARDLHRAQGSVDQEALALTNLATVHIDSGDLPGARASLTRAAALFAELGNHSRSVYTETCLGQLDLLEGDAAAAEARLSAAVAAAREAANRREEGVALVQLAEVQGERGDPRALDACTRAISLVSGVNARSHGKALAIAGWLHAEAGRPDASVEAFGALRQLLDEQPDPLLDLEGDAYRARALLAEGRRDEGSAAAAALAARAAELPVPYPLRRLLDAVRDAVRREGQPVG